MDVMIGLGAACLLIRLGLVLYRTGLLRAKNAAGAVLCVLTDLCVSTLAMWAVGRGHPPPNQQLLFGNQSQAHRSLRWRHWNPVFPDDCRVGRHGRRRRGDGRAVAVLPRFARPPSSWRRW